MGFLGQLFGNYAQAEQYKGQARVERAKGRMERAAAYNQAAKVEDEGKAANVMAAENAMRQRKAQTAARAAVRNERSASGFTSEGSGSMAELSVAEQMEQMIADTALSGAYAERNARDEARVIRGNGEMSMMGADLNAQSLEILAKGAKKAALMQGLVGLAGTVVGAVSGGLAGGLSGMLMGGAQIGGAAGSVAGNFTQFMPGSVRASESSMASFGSDINEIWKAFGGSGFYK